MQQPIKLLKSNQYGPLFFAQFSTIFNDNFFKQALFFLFTYDTLVIPKQSNHWINLASMLFLLPFFLFSALSGELSDKYRKSSILKIVKVFEIAIVLLILYALHKQHTIMLLIAIFLFGLHSALLSPAKYAILPELLKKNELIAGNAFTETGTFAAILLGMLSSYLIVHAQYGHLIADSLLLCLALLGFWSALKIPDTPAQSPTLRINLNCFVSTNRILQLAREQRIAWRCILGISCFWLLSQSLFAILPAFVRDVLQANAITVSAYFALFLLGFIGGAFTCNRLLGDKIHTHYCLPAALGFVFCLIDLYFVSSYMTSLVSIHAQDIFNIVHFAIDLALIAFCGGIFTVPLYTMLQLHSPESTRAQIIAANNIVNASFMIIGSGLISLCYLSTKPIPYMFLSLAFINIGTVLLVSHLLPETWIQSLLKKILTVLYQVEIYGRSEYPNPDEKFIIFANHTSYLDILLICAFLPDTFTIAANSNIIQSWWLKPFLILACKVPIDPTSPMATRTIIEQVQQGAKYVILPEGALLATTGALMKIYESPGLIAEKAHAKIVPIRIEGAQYAFPFSKLSHSTKARLFPKITLTILPALELSLSAQTQNSRERRREYSIRLYRLMRDMMFCANEHRNTLYQALIQARDNYGKKYLVAEDLDRKEMSYRQFLLKTVILARYIKTQSHFSEHIGILLPTTITTMISFFALQLIGRIPAMINFSSGLRNLLHACELTGIQQIYTSRKFVDTLKFGDLIASIEQAGIKIHYLEDLRGKIGPIQKLLGGLYYLNLKCFHHRFEKKMRPSDTATILFTSGSEGKPKAVALSHLNILSNCYQLRASIDFTSKDTVFNALPVFHSFGLTVGSILPLVSGVKVFFYPSPLHYRVVPELIYDCNATLLFGTDTFLSGYARYAHSYDFYSIRYVFSGAEKLKTKTYHIWAEKFGVRIFEGYGATETAPVLSCNTPMENKLGSVGRFMPGIRYRLEPVEGFKQSCMVSKYGRLFVKGPNIMLGYFSDPNTLVQPERGWYDTGDIVCIDKDGFVEICDRAKRFAKIGGEMVSLTGIEHFIAEYAPSDMHACVRRPDPKKGEQIIWITTALEANLTVLIQVMRAAGFPEIAMPKKVHMLEKIPLLGSGKTDYVALNALLEFTL